MTSILLIKFEKRHSGTAKITLWMPCQSEYGPPGSTKTLGTGSFSKDQYPTYILYLQGQVHFYNFYKFQKSHSGTAKMTLWMPCQSEYGPPGATKTLETGSISKISTWHTLYTYKAKVTKITLWMPCQSEYTPPGATKTPGTGTISKISTWHTLYTYKVKVTSILLIKFKKVTLARLKWHFECRAKVNMGNLVPPKPWEFESFSKISTQHTLYILQGQGTLL